MKAHIARFLLPLIFISAPINLQSAEPFQSGSNGSHGALIVAARAQTNLTVPPDGIFHFTAVRIGANATVRFTPNALNTPVYLLATEDIVCQGDIIVSGQDRVAAIGGAAGPGGFAGGFGGSDGANSAPGDGRGPGGGRFLQRGQSGVFAAAAGANTNTYGNALLDPLVGGSGGCGNTGSPGEGGGGGGGAILIAATTRIEINLDSSDSGFEGVWAVGGFGWGCGSGGAIRLVAPVVTGNGRLSAAGSGSNTSQRPDGSPGRIRIDCLDDFAYRTLTYSGSFTRGSEMFVFRPNAPRLAIIEAAGTQIPVGNPGPVTVSLPFGAPINQIVRLQGTGFAANTPIQVTVTPDTGPSASFDAVIPAGNPSAVSVEVVIPAGAISFIDAWTR